MDIRLNGSKSQVTQLKATLSYFKLQSTNNLNFSFQKIITTVPSNASILRILRGKWKMVQSSTYDSHIDI